MNETVINFWNNHSVSIADLGRRIIALVLVIVAGKVAVAISNGILKRVSNGTLKAEIDETIVTMLKLAIKYLTIIICAIMILDLFGINTASLIAVLGAAGVAVGIGLKDTLGNIAAGIALLVLRSYRKGDFIEFGSFSGSVKEMGLFTTILQTPDGIYISAPNSSVWGVPLKNYSRNSRRRMELAVSISYSDSIDAAFAVMQNIIETEPRFLPDPGPQVLVQSLGESGVNIVLRAWANSGDYWAAYSFQMKNVKEKIEAAGLHIPFPQQDVHLDIVNNK